LYSREEKKELERVKKEITASVKKLKKTLAEKGIAVSEIVRSGYPDEEILKAADEYAVSLILLPSGSSVPSELSKAAAIILEESAQLKWPVFLLPPAEAV
jgi:nucleotide-binding universal stress UspA family protein